MIRDDDVGITGPFPGTFSQTLWPERAVLRSQALVGTHRDLIPRLLTVGGRVVPIAHPVLCCLLLGPLTQGNDLGTEFTGLIGALAV